MKITWNSELSRGHRAVKALLAAGLSLGIVTLFLVRPEHLPFANCTFHALTGHSCLTCGMTRSLHAISHGELISSLHYHLMGPVLFMATLLFLIVLAAEVMTGKRIAYDMEGRSKKQVILLFAIVWLVYWGARVITEFVA